MITELTKEQEALMDVVRDEWLAKGLRTSDKIDKKAAREAIIEAYKCADLTPPKNQFIFFGRSPREGALIVAICKDFWENQDKTVPTRKKIDEYLEQFRELKANDKKIPEPQSKLAQDAFQWACYGQHDAGWLSFYDFFERIGVEGLEQLKGLKMAADACGWWWPMSQIAVITEMPNQLHLDEEGRLHSEDSMAISYTDDWGLYVWHGVNVTEKIIMRPETITSEDIMTEDNAEIRRIMIERMGEDRFLESANAKLVHEDKDDLDFPRKLWRVDFEGRREDPWVAVQVVNSTPEPDGSRRKFVIPVPPDIETCQQALAWTFGMGADEYQPGQQT